MYRKQNRKYANQTTGVLKNEMQDDRNGEERLELNAEDEQIPFARGKPHDEDNQSMLMMHRQNKTTRIRNCCLRTKATRRRGRRQPPALGRWRGKYRSKQKRKKRKIEEKEGNRNDDCNHYCRFRAPPLNSNINNRQTKQKLAFALEGSGLEHTLHLNSGTGASPHYLPPPLWFHLHTAVSVRLYPSCPPGLPWSRWG